MTMRLDKAIEILNCRQIPLKTAQDHDFFDALKMGIAGLERIQFLQDPQHKPKEPLLPGQTED